MVTKLKTNRAELETLAGPLAHAPPPGLWLGNQSSDDRSVGSGAETNGYFNVNILDLTVVSKLLCVSPARAWEPHYLKPLIPRTSPGRWGPLGTCAPPGHLIWEAEVGVTVLPIPALLAKVPY